MVAILLGVEAEVRLKRIASYLVQKWKYPYSRTCRYMKSRVGFTIARATHRCILGGRVPVSHISVTRPHW